MPETRYVVGVDFSAESRGAAGAAARIAARTGSSVDLVCVLPEDAQREEGAVLRAEERLAELASNPGAAGVVVTTHVMLAGDVAEALADHAESRGAALLVLAARGATGWRKRLLGGTTERVLRRSHVPVLVLRQPDPLATRPRLLVAADRSPGAARALRSALVLARSLDASVLALRVVRPRYGELLPGELLDADAAWRREESRLRAGLEELTALVDAVDHGHVPVEKRVVPGSPPEAIVEEARGEGATLIVLGMHSRTRLHELFVGSVARAVASAATCSVLLVPGGPAN